MRSWSIKGVPLTTQTMVFTTAFSGLNRLMEPNEIIKPMGSAPNKVKKNILIVCKKPPLSSIITLSNMIPFQSFFRTQGKGCPQKLRPRPHAIFIQRWSWPFALGHPFHTILRWNCFIVVQLKILARHKFLQFLAYYRLHRNLQRTDLIILQDRNLFWSLPRILQNLRKLYKLSFRS